MTKTELDLNKIAFFGPWDPNTTYTKDNCYLFKNKHGKVIIIDTDGDGEKEEFTMFACSSLSELEVSKANSIFQNMLSFREGKTNIVKNFYEKNPQPENMDGKDDCWTSYEKLDKKFPGLGDKLEKLLPKLRRHGNAPTLTMLGVEVEILSDDGKLMNFAQWVQKNTGEENSKYDWNDDGFRLLESDCAPRNDVNS